MPNRRELGYVSAGSTSTVYVSTGIYGRATGGIGSPTAVTISGVNYEYLTFNATGTLTVTTAGWFDFLAIGGGSGSNIRNDSARANGGGGAGAVVCGSIYLSANQTITIGAGGSFVNYGAYSVGTQTNIGAASPFVVSAGGSIAVDGNYAQASGMGRWGNGTTTQTFNTGLGFNGGASSASTSGGGGGGWSSAGVDGSGTTGGAGGTGFDMSTFIGGTPTPSHRATGGGGGGSVAGGAGGNSSASSNAGSTGSTPSSAAANSGSGGGGGNGTTQTTGNGGSGVCFIRWSVS